MNGLAVFGESTQNTTDSKYTYSNVVSLELMSELAKRDSRFDNINQADVLNIALMLLDGFITSKDPKSKGKLHEFIDDFEEFKFFAINTINHTRMMNAGYNMTIDDFISQRGEQDGF